MHKQAKPERIHRRAHRLVQQRLDQRVGLVQARLDDAALGGLVVELGVVGGGGRGESLAGWGDVVGREGGLEEVLPEEVGGG